jgi:hypothetical protein
MARQPHARPVDPPPEEPAAEETLAELLHGLAGVAMIFALLFVILPILVS